MNVCLGTFTHERTLMHNRKRIDPTIDPCGTPHLIHKKDDEVLFIDTN